MASRNQPVIIVQNQTNNAVINLNDKNNVRFNIVAFLRSQGINTLDLVLIPYDADNKMALNLLREYITVQNVSLQEKEAIKSIIMIAKTPNYFNFKFADKTWLLIIGNQDIDLSNMVDTDILIWDGETLNTQQLKQIKMKKAIANIDKINQEILDYLDSNNIEIFPLEKGAIQWKPNTGFKIFNNE